MNSGNIETNLQAVVDEFFPNENEPGCCVLVVQGNDTTILRAGLANLEQNTPVSSATNFRLASVAKQFTAASILKLRDEGRLRLEQRLTDFFPDFPAYGWAIMVEHLLRHTSGIKDYEPLVELLSPEQPVMDAEVLQILADQEAGDFEPGSRFRYSNSGYAVLSQIVEHLSGLDFPTYLRQAFFEPLRMSNSIALVNRPDSPEVPNRAMGYAQQPDGGFRLNDQSATSAVIGDGGIYTSADDYAKWIRAYMAGDVLSQATVEQAWTPTKTTSGDIVPYGYGWRLEEVKGQWLPYHPGSTTGFRNGVVLNPDRNLAVLALTNSNSGDAVALAKAIRQQLIS